MDPRDQFSPSTEERFALFLETACDYGMFFMNAEGIVTEWSNGAEKLLGYRESEIVGQPGATIFTPEDREQRMPEREMESAQATGQAIDERCHQRKDGSRFFATGRMVCLRDSAGHVRGYAKILRDVDDLKELEAASHTMAEYLPASLWILDALGHCLDVNHVWTKLTGLSDDDTSGDRYLQVIHQDDREKFLPVWHTALREKQPLHFGLRIRAADQSYRWHDLRAYPIQPKDGSVHRWLAFASDIHETVEARERAEAEELRWREVFQAAFEGIWILNTNAQIVVVNPRMAEMLGYTPEEMVGKTKWDFIFPEDEPWIRQLFEERRRGLPAQTDVRFRRKDGTELWTQMSARPLQRKGEFSGALDLFSPLTQERVLERQLIASERRFRAFFETSAAGHAQVDLTTRKFVTVNRRFCEMMRYSEDELRRLTFSDVTHPDDRERDTDRFERLITGEIEKYSAEKRYVRKDGTFFWARLSVALERGADAQPVRTVGVVEDITGLKLAAEELEARVQERTAALNEKTRQLEDFCYTVAHDLRAPLRTIAGYAELLETDYSDRFGNEPLAYLAKIRGAAGRLDRLIQDLLGYSRVEQVALVRSTVSLDALLPAVLRDLESEIARAGAKFEVTPELGTVTGDEGILRHVLVNLISNAVKFRKPNIAPQVKIYTQQNDGKVRLFVQDNGIGLSPRHAEKAFRMFERLHGPEYAGTGVGLAIVSRAMERLGGTRGVDSEPGVGSRFWIELPASPRS